MQALTKEQAMAYRAKGISRRQSKDIGERVAKCIVNLLNDDNLWGGVYNDEFPGVENTTLASKFRQIVKAEGLEDIVFVSGSGGKTTVTKLVTDEQEVSKVK